MNPYSTPESDQAHQESSLNSQLREIVVAWEKMRIPYNIILLVAGVLAIIAITNSNPAELSLLILPAILFAIFANVCFCVGPTAETYARVIFNIQKTRILRKVLFSLGTLSSLIPAALVILASIIDTGPIF